MEEYVIRVFASFVFFLHGQKSLFALIHSQSRKKKSPNKDVLSDLFAFVAGLQPLFCPKSTPQMEHVHIKVT